MSDIINTRSPYYFTEGVLSTTVTPPYVAIWDVSIWSGTLASLPTPQYRFTQNIIIPRTYLEISEIARDYIDITYGALNTDNLVWIKYTMTIYDESLTTVVHTNNDTLLCTDGYGYFEDGLNPNLSGIIMMDARKIIIPEENEISIPVFSELVTKVEYRLKTTVISTDTITNDTVSGNKIKYSTYDYESLEIDNILVTHTTGTIGLDVINNLDCKYDKIQCDFVNKYGAIERLFFNAKSTKSDSVTNDSYQSNVLTLDRDYPIYGTTSHQFVNYNTNGKTTIIANTGFIPEDLNSAIDQLMFTEKCWLTIDSVVYPVKVASKAMQYKTVINDKLINYTISFEVASNKVQNVR